MSAPHVDVDLDKIRHNTRSLVGRLDLRGIRLTAVTKAVCGHPSIAKAMLDGGASGLAEPRLNNVMRLRQAGVTCPVTLVRTPMLSQVDEIVRFCEASYNTEPSVIAALATAALRQNKVHGVILMVEMGDRREGIQPRDLGALAHHVVDLPGVALQGIGANFACLNGQVPTPAKMRALSIHANDIEGQCGPFVQTVSGGNSANLQWAFGPHATGRINDLRIGEAILLGVDPISGDKISGLFQDAFTLVAEVIETHANSVRPCACNDRPTHAQMQSAQVMSDTTRIILAVGLQDTDATGLSMPPGTTFIGATSDHLVVGARQTALRVGSKMRFQMTYGALMRAMAAPDVQTNLRDQRPAPNAHDIPPLPHKHLALV